jgi:hypothetical protein
MRARGALRWGNPNGFIPYVIYACHLLNTSKVPIYTVWYFFHFRFHYCLLRAHVGLQGRLVWYFANIPVVFYLFVALSIYSLQ